MESVMLHSAVVGLSWKTALQSLRDRAHISLEEEDVLVERLAKEAGLDQVVVLSTCNRIELYLVAPDPQVAAARAWEVWANFRGLEEADTHIYRHFHADAVRHLFQVAASVDSIVQGETQISGQIRDARSRAQQRGPMDPFLQRLFQDALACSKRVRTATSLGEGVVSIASAAVQLASEQCDLSHSRVAILGGGVMAQAAWHSFRAHGTRDFRYVNRRPERVEPWAREVPGPVYGLMDLETALSGCDILLAAIRSPIPLIGPALLAGDTAPRLILDISAPRVVETACDGLSGMKLHGIDDLREVVERNRQFRADRALEAETLIEEDVSRFSQWVHARTVLNEVREVRESAHEIAHELVSRHVHHLQQLAGTERFEEELDGLAQLLVNKILHAPTRAATSLAAEGREDEARALLSAFLRTDA